MPSSIVLSLCVSGQLEEGDDGIVVRFALGRGIVGPGGREVGVGVEDADSFQHLEQAAGDEDVVQHLAFALVDVVVPPVGPHIIQHMVQARVP